MHRESAYSANVIDNLRVALVADEGKVAHPGKGLDKERRP